MSLNFAYIAKNYQLLDHGSALGRKNGPLLISQSRVYLDEINEQPNSQLL